MTNKRRKRTGYKKCRSQSEGKRTKQTTQGKAKMSASPQKASHSPNRRGYYPGNETASLFAPNYDPLRGPLGILIEIRFVTLILVSFLISYCDSISSDNEYFFFILVN